MKESIPMKQKAYLYIMNRMIAGEILPGMRISEISIAKMIKMSRTPVHDAIGQMVAEGMMERVPRFGTIVKKFSECEVEEIYDLRIALEGFAAGRAALCISAEMLDELKTCCELIKTVAENFSRKTLSDDQRMKLKNDLSRADMDFHLLIMRASKNRMLLKSAYDSHLISRIFAIPRTPVFDEGYSSRIFENHYEIYEAIRSGQQENAVKAMTAHIENSKNHTLLFMKRQAEEEQKSRFASHADSLLSF